MVLDSAVETRSEFEALLDRPITKEEEVIPSELNDEKKALRVANLLAELYPVCPHCGGRHGMQDGIDDAQQLLD